MVLLFLSKILSRDTERKLHLFLIREKDLIYIARASKAIYEFEFDFIFLKFLGPAFLSKEFIKAAFERKDNECCVIIVKRYVFKVLRYCNAVRFVWELQFCASDFQEVWFNLILSDHLCRFLKSDNSCKVATMPDLVFADRAPHSMNLLKLFLAVEALYLLDLLRIDKSHIELKTCGVNLILGVVAVHTFGLFSIAIIVSVAFISTVLRLLILTVIVVYKS